jgi:hypothetical protein
VPTSQDRALLAAAQHGDVGAARTALDAGADHATRSRSTGRTALIEATIAGHTDVVRLLLAAGADTEARCTAVGLPALAWAASEGDLDVVRALLDAGAEADAGQTRTGSTPLLWAAQSGTPAVVAALIAAGADVDAVNAFGDAPLTAAEQRTDAAGPQVVALLREHGAHLPGPPPEPPVIGWPAVDPAAPDHADPVALTRAFLLALHAWEQDAHHTVLEAGEDYLTPRRRPYRPDSVGYPPRFSADDLLHEIRTPTRSRTELVLRQAVDRPVRAERVVVLIRAGGQWRIDQIKERSLVWDDRYRSLL